MSDSVEFEVVDGTAWLRLNRPAALNALDDDMRGLMETRLADIEADRSIRALTITGAGKAFCAGSDIRELGGMDAHASIALSNRIEAFHDRLRRLPVPVVAAINGACLGGGLELALACDLRVASASAKLGLPEPRLGLMTGGGGLPRLARLIGSGPARHLALTGEIIDAARALELHVVGRVFQPDDFARGVADFVAGFARLSPFALSRIKRTMIAAEEHSLTTALAEEARGCAACVAGPDIDEGVSAFTGKRAPRFDRNRAG